MGYEGTGTSGYVLTSAGPTSQPYWAASGGGGGLAQNNIFYVSTSGNNGNPGTNINTAVLTFAQAISLATAQTPSATKRFAIVCYDDAIYPESITVPSYVDIYAPNATLGNATTGGSITVNDYVNIKFFTLNVLTGANGVFKAFGSNYADVEVEIMNLAGTAVGFVSLAGLLNCTWKQIYVATGAGVSDQGSSAAHMHLRGGDIYVTGTGGVGVRRTSTGFTVGTVDHLVDQGGTGTGISISGGTVDMYVSRIDNATSYNVTSSSIAAVLNLVASTIVNAGVCSGTNARANVWTSPTYPIAQAGMNNGQIVIGSTGANPVVASLSAGTGISITPGAGSISIAATGSSSLIGVTETVSPFTTTLGYGTPISTTGLSNTAVGWEALNSVSGSNNVAMGYQALNNLGASSNCIAIGYNAGFDVAVENTIAIGSSAMSGSTVTGPDNIAIGRNALLSVTSGDQNIAIGTGSLENLITGSNCIAMGYATGSNIKGNNNIALGAGALGTGTVTGADNFGVGVDTLSSLTSGNENISIGDLSSFSMSTGSGNVVIGYDSLQGNNGSYNTVIGFESGASYSSAESSNILIGPSLPGGVGESHTIRIGSQGSSPGEQNTCFIAGINGATVNSANVVGIAAATGQLAATTITAGSNITITPSSGAITIASTGGGGGAFSINRQVFTSSGTYTPTSGMTYADVEVVGGGGGGGASGSGYEGAGGGGGGYARGLFTASTIGASKTITIGAGGTAGISGGSGGTGGTTLFGSLISATGGVGGSLYSSAGGTGSGGDFQTTGTPGRTEEFGGGTGAAGEGGSTFFGGGGGGTGGIGLAGTSFGGGGGGGTTSNNGAAGYAGVVIVTEYIGTSIANTPYTSVSNGASPYVVLPADNFLGCLTSTGVITILLPNAPSTGRVFEIKDVSGSAGTSNITVTTVGGTVTIDGLTSLTMSVAYQSISVLFNGTSYVVY